MIRFSEVPTQLTGVYQEFAREITHSIAGMATSLRLTRYTYTEQGFFSTSKQFTDDDPVIQTVLSQFNVEYIKDEKLNTVYYGDSDKFGSSGEGHVYWYRITEKVRSILRASTIIIEHESSENLWPGFEDPVYYKDETVIAFVISTKKMIYCSELPEFESIIDRFNIPFEKVI